MSSRTTTNRATLGRNLIFGCLLFSLMGCVTLPVKHPNWPWSDRPRTGEVGQVMALWADGLVVHPDPTRNGTPTPGFSARVYLFAPELGDPLAAEGPLTVHLYDNTKRTEGKPVPSEVWNIDQVNLDQVLTKDGLGWGYNLWLPWSTYSRAAKKVSLVVEYKPEEGKTVYSGSMSMNVNAQDSKKRPSRLYASKARELPHRTAVTGGAVKASKTEKEEPEVLTLPLMEEAAPVEVGESVPVSREP